MPYNITEADFDTPVAKERFEVTEADFDQPQSEPLSPAPTKKFSSFKRFSELPKSEAPTQLVDVPQPTPEEWLSLPPEEQRRIIDQLNQAETARIHYEKLNPSRAGTFGREAASGVAPGLAFAGGFAAGAPLGLEFGPVGALVTGTAGGMMASTAASELQDLAFKTIAPEQARNFQEMLQVGREQYPYTATAGRLAGGLASFEASVPRTIAEAGKRAVIGGALASVPAVTEGRLPTAQEALEGAIGGTFLGEPRIKGLRVPITTTKGEPNAIYQEANGPVRNLRNAPGEGAQQVPIESGSQEATARRGAAPAEGIAPEVQATEGALRVEETKPKEANEKEKGQEKEGELSRVAPAPGAVPTEAAPGLQIPDGAKPEAIALAKEYNGRLPELEKLAADNKAASGAALESARKRAKATGNPDLLNTPKIQELSQRHQTSEEAVNILRNQPAPEQVQPSGAAIGIAPPGTDLAQRIIEWAKVLPSKLAGKAAPLTSRASEESGNALVRFASSKIAAPQVAKARATDVLGEHYGDADFSKRLGAVLVEDRLRGLKKQFNDEAQRQSDKAQQEARAGNATAAAEAQKAALEAQKNANGVETIIGKPESPFAAEGDFTSALNDPEIQAAINRHKHVVQLEAQIAHEETGGDLAGRGLNTDAFVNLKAVMPGAEEVFGATSKGNLENPLKRSTRFGKEAKGTAKKYELDYRTLAERMIRGNFEELSKRQFYDQLIKDGLAIEQEPGLPAPKIGGKPTERFTIERRGGRTRYLWLRKDLAREFRNAEDVEGPVSKSGLIEAANVINRIQLAGPTDAVWHVANMLGSIAGSQGGKNVLTDLARKLPGVNIADAIGKVTASAIKVMRDSPEIQQQLAEITRIGAGRAEHSSGMLGKLINTVDRAGRLVRDDMYKNLVDRGLVTASEAGKREWINQLGQYNPRLMGQFQRFFKEAGFSPFIVAGRNFNRMAARRITLDPGIKAANPAAYWEMKGIEAFGIMATLVAVPSLINYVITGNPNGRDGTKFGQIDTGKDGPDGRHIVIDPAQWTGLRRGLSISGAGAVIEETRKGAPPKKVAQKAITDILGGIIHPWAGPAVSAPVIGVTGYSPTLYKESENPKDYGENVKAALKQLNPVAESLITAHEKDEGKVTSTALDLAGAAGVKQVYPTTAQQRVSNLVSNWMRKSGNPKLEKKYENRLKQDFDSDYSDLREAINANNTKKAKEELAKLKGYKDKKQIFDAMRQRSIHPFTGTLEDEAKFRKSLTKEELELYKKAREEKKAEYQKFLEVWKK